MHAVSNIRTASAKRYLGQLTKHFAHKIPVELAADACAGKIVFAAGTCRLKADGERLLLELEATGDGLATLKDVVARHLERFAFREQLAVEWRHVIA